MESDQGPTPFQLGLARYTYSREILLHYVPTGNSDTDTQYRYTNSSFLKSVKSSKAISHQPRSTSRSCLAYRSVRAIDYLNHTQHSYYSWKYPEYVEVYRSSPSDFAFDDCTSTKQRPGFRPCRGERKRYPRLL